MKLYEFFPRIVLINLERRKDRLQESLAELDANNIPRDKVERFEAYDHPTSGHIGCSRSHRILLRGIAEGSHERVLILEDDFQVVTRPILAKAGFKPEQEVWKVHCSILNGFGDLNQRFSCLVDYLPEAWDVLYLGGSFQEPPISRLNKHVIRCGGMLTTSSYGITKEFAKKWTEAADKEGDLAHFIGPIDLFFSKLSHTNNFYVVQPRLLFQRMSYSDLDGGTHSRLFDMTDPAGESQV